MIGLRPALVSLIVAAVVTEVFAQPSKRSSNSELQSRPLYQSIQQALDILSRAEIAREEASLVGRDTRKLVDVREQCRVAIAQLLVIENQLVDLLRQGYQKKPSTRERNSWTLQELESLSRHLKVQLARGYRNQALCYSDGSVDRVNALSLALEQLPDVISQPLDEASIWQARIEQIVCLRLLKQTDKAQRQVLRWRIKSPPGTVASRLTGEELRINLDAGALDRALTIVEAIQQETDQSTEVVPETDDAILETLLAARTHATSNQARQVTQRAVEQLQHIATAHGPYWRRRAEIRLGQALAEQNDSDDPELLSYAAASLYATGKSREAVATYDRIASLLAASSREDRQFEALKTAAAIIREMKRPAAAMTRFRELALQQPKHDEATAMHLTSIGLAADLARNSAPSDRGEKFEHYITLLEEHLQQWPNSPSAKDVRQWLDHTERPEIERQRAQTLAALGDKPQALELYRKLLSDSPDDAELLAAFAQLLTESNDEPELREALQTWNQIEKRSKPGGPRWWRGRRARLTLLEQLGEGEQAKKLQQLTKILYPEGRNDE